MRSDNYVAPTPRHLDPQYQVSTRGTVLTVICGILLVGIAVLAYVVSDLPLTLYSYAGRRI